MDEVLWPDDPKRDGGGSPPGAVESGEGPRALTLLVAPEDLIQEHGAWIRRRFSPDWEGASLEGARAWASKQTGVQWVHLVADQRTLLSIPGLKENRSVGLFFGVPHGRVTWLAASAADVFRAPRNGRWIEILALTSGARWAAALPRRLTDIRIRAAKDGLHSSIHFTSSFVPWPWRREHHG